MTTVEQAERRKKEVNPSRVPRPQNNVVREGLQRGPDTALKVFWEKLRNRTVQILDADPASLLWDSIQEIQKFAAVAPDKIQIGTMAFVENLLSHLNLMIFFKEVPSVIPAFVRQYHRLNELLGLPDERLDLLEQLEESKVQLAKSKDIDNELLAIAVPYDPNRLETEQLALQNLPVSIRKAFQPAVSALLRPSIRNLLKVCRNPRTQQDYLHNLEHIIEFIDELNDFHDNMNGLRPIIALYPCCLFIQPQAMAGAALVTLPANVDALTALSVMFPELLGESGLRQSSAQQVAAIPIAKRYKNLLDALGSYQFPLLAEVCIACQGVNKKFLPEVFKHQKKFLQWLSSFLMGWMPPRQRRDIILAAVRTPSQFWGNGRPLFGGNSQELKHWFDETFQGQIGEIAYATLGLDGSPQGVKRATLWAMFPCLDHVRSVVPIDALAIALELKLLHHQRHVYFSYACDDFSIASHCPAYYAPTEDMMQRVQLISRLSFPGETQEIWHDYMQEIMSLDISKLPKHVYPTVFVPTGERAGEYIVFHPNQQKTDIHLPIRLWVRLFDAFRRARMYQLITPGPSASTFWEDQLPKLCRLDDPLREDAAITAPLLEPVIDLIESDPAKYVGEDGCINQQALFQALNQQSMFLSFPYGHILEDEKIKKLSPADRLLIGCLVCELDKPVSPLLALRMLTLYKEVFLDKDSWFAYKTLSPDVAYRLACCIPEHLEFTVELVRVYRKVAGPYALSPHRHPLFNVLCDIARYAPSIAQTIVKEKVPENDIDLNQHIIGFLYGFPRILPKLLAQPQLFVSLDDDSKPEKFLDEYLPEGHTLGVDWGFYEAYYLHQKEITSPDGNLDPCRYANVMYPFPLKEDDPRLIGEIFPPKIVMSVANVLLLAPELKGLPPRQLEFIARGIREVFSSCGVPPNNFACVEFWEPVKRILLHASTLWPSYQAFRKCLLENRLFFQWRPGLQDLGELAAVPAEQLPLVLQKLRKQTQQK